MTPEDTIAIRQRAEAIARTAWEAAGRILGWNYLAPASRKIMIEIAHQGLLAGMNARGRE